MKILVTGAAGRIGQWVVRELAGHGHSIRALDHRPLPEDLRGSVETVFADIGDPIAMLSALAGCDSVAHIAAYAMPGFVTNAELIRVNVGGTQNILDAAMAHGIPKVVITSSIGALGFSFPTHPCLPDYLPVDAAHPRRPQDVYGLSKLMNEESAAAATRLSGLTTIVLRPPWVGDLERARARGWLARMTEDSDEHMRKDLWAYIDVRDVAVAYRLALESDLTGHHLFYTMADDVASATPVPTLAERYLPQLASQVDRLTGSSFYDLKPARERLGFAAGRTWRQVLEEG